MEGYINQNGQLIYLSEQTFKLLPKSEQRNYKKYVKVKEPAEVSNGPKSTHEANTSGGAINSANTNQSGPSQASGNRATKRGRRPRVG